MCLERDLNLGPDAYYIAVDYEWNNRSIIIRSSGFLYFWSYGQIFLVLWFLFIMLIAFGLMYLSHYVWSNRFFFLCFVVPIELED